MGTKTIGLDDEVYERLKTQKREGESFTDTVERITEEMSADWRRSFGRYAEEGERFERAVTESHERSGAGLSKRQGRVSDVLQDDDEAARKHVPRPPRPRHRGGGGVPLGTRKRGARHLHGVEEIAVGALAVSDPTKEELLVALGWVRVFPFTAERVYCAGEFEADLRADPDVQQDRRDSPMDDLPIAGVARAIDAPVVTRDVEDFEFFDGVSVEAY